ncbi:hypothetical protein K1719_002088 [Acacia pycnantha]|nr:hypothetical protein K1719_002088 [Acacia pycnantha]
MVAPRLFFPVLPPLLALRVLSRSPSPIWKISWARSPCPSAMTSKEILHKIKKRCTGCNIWIEFLWKKLDCQILIQGKERGRCDVDSCGVHVISWLQMWDATEQEDGYTMPSYSMDEIQELKIGMLWWLMLQNGI